MKHAVLLALFLPGLGAQSQTGMEHFEVAYSAIDQMLTGERAYDPEHAVFLVENAFLDGRLDSAGFADAIRMRAAIARAWAKANPLRDYHAADSVIFAMNRAAYHVLADTIFLAPGLPLLLPIRYDTVDFFGDAHWESTLVSKLLETGVGTCHSMPLLYMLICRRLGTDAHLAYAPHHLYVKQYSEQLGWYNTELTSWQFPTDAWIMATGYVHPDAVRSGMYLDTLGNQGTLALCLMDLALGHQRQYQPSDASFAGRCARRALEAHPNSPVAQLTQIELFTQTFEGGVEANQAQARSNLVAALRECHANGYRQVPREVYLEWMKALSTSGRFASY